MSIRFLKRVFCEKNVSNGLSKVCFTFFCLDSRSVPFVDIGAEVRANAGL